MGHADVGVGRVDFFHSRSLAGGDVVEDAQNADKNAGEEDAAQVNCARADLQIKRFFAAGAGEFGKVHEGQVHDDCCAKRQQGADHGNTGATIKAVRKVEGQKGDSERGDNGSREWRVAAGDAGDQKPENNTGGKDEPDNRCQAALPSKEYGERKKKCDQDENVG